MLLALHIQWQVRGSTIKKLPLCLISWQWQRNETLSVVVLTLWVNMEAGEAAKVAL